MTGFEKTNKTTRPAPQQDQSNQSLFRKPGEGFFNRKPLVSPETRNFYRSIQQKSLEVNQPGDAHEQEADAVADKVMRMPSTAAAPTAAQKEETLQRKEKEGEPEDRMQIGSTDHAPLAPAEREPDEMQIGEIDPAPLRRKPAGMLEEEDRMRTGDTDMAPLQRKEEEDMVQAKGEGTPDVTPSLETSLQRSKGGGNPLPDGVKQQMEGGIGADFSNVRVHTGPQAAQMSNSIQAQAFTHGKDIYFNEGKYSPGTDSGKHLLAHELTHTVQQGAANKVSRKGETGPGTKKPASVPVGKLGIVSRDGEPKLRLRSKPSTEAAVLAELPLNTIVQVIDYPGGDRSWYHVITKSGREGYVASTYVKTNIPEPTARLHRIKPGESAIGIAQKYFGAEAGKWGMDLRFYVNAIAYLNGLAAPNTSFGWMFVGVTANNFIWIPGTGFAKGLKGKINSGSFSYNTADALGVAKYAEGIMQKLTDFKNAMKFSSKYMIPAIVRHCGSALKGAINGLIEMAIESVIILGITTAVGAALGALAGGVGAIPGAEAGFELGMLILEWMGLAMLIGWLKDALVGVGKSFAKFFKIVWNANGNLKVLEQGGIAFAEAIGTLMGELTNAVVLYLMHRIAGGKGKEGKAKLQEGRMGREPGVIEWAEGEAARRGQRPADPASIRTEKAPAPSGSTTVRTTEPARTVTKTTERAPGPKETTTRPLTEKAPGPEKLGEHPSTRTTSEPLRTETTTTVKEKVSVEVTEEPVARPAEKNSSTREELPKPKEETTTENSGKNSETQQQETKETENNIVAETSSPAFEKITLSDGTVVKRLKANSEYTSNGYNYKTDGLGRISSVEGKLKLEKGGRDPYAQRTVGKGDGRLPDDHGGHMIGDQFGGAGGKENLVPMNKEVNNYHSGEWGQMERNWADNLKKGNTVEVRIETIYSDNSMRPSGFTITETINGITKKITIFN